MNRTGSYYPAGSALLESSTYIVLLYAHIYFIFQIQTNNAEHCVIIEVISVSITTNPLHNDQFHEQARKVFILERGRAACS